MQVDEHCLGLPYQSGRQFLRYKNEYGSSTGREVDHLEVLCAFGRIHLDGTKLYSEHLRASIHQSDHFEMYRDGMECQRRPQFEGGRCVERHYELQPCQR